MNGQSTGQIIFNCMPPALTLSPSPAFSILKGFMQQQGYDSRIIYWNRLIYNLYVSKYPDFKFTSQLEVEIQFILPFLFQIAEQYTDRDAENKLISYFLSSFPTYAIKHRSARETIQQIWKDVCCLMDEELEKLQSEHILIFGFSFKFFQWIPASILAEKIKRKFPSAKIVIGGFIENKSAVDLMYTCKHFDFAVYGEGEYPLLELCRHMTGEPVDLDAVPRLLYRDGDRVIQTRSKSRYLSFEEYPGADFSDFANMPESKGILDRCMFPIEGSRSCYWGRCKFCSFNKGYKYRRRSPQSIVAQIEDLVKTYRTSSFRFVDNDIVGEDNERFEKLLDAIIQSSIQNRVKYHFFAEILDYGFDAGLIEKLAIAGFEQVQIGYEAITDKLLKNMDKRTDFASHILFVKFALKFGIVLAGPNIIMGTVGETGEDVLESIQNLVFLRFWLGKERGQLQHSPIELRFQEGSPYLNMLNSEERKECIHSDMGYLLPGPFIEEDRRFNLYGVSRGLKNRREWENFKKTNTFFEDTKFNYRILRHNDVYYFSEYMNNDLVNYIVFDKPEYWMVLQLANEHVVSFQSVFLQLRESFPKMTENDLTEIIDALKEDHLLYANSERSRLVSVIDTSEAQKKTLLKH